MRTASRAAVVAGVGAAVALARRLASHTADGHKKGREDHWLAVTAYRPLEQVTGAESLPAPLERLRGGIEVRFRPAAGDKGTELLARPVGEEVSREELRIALRQAKSLLETGGVVHPDTTGSTHPGPAGKVLQMVIGKSKGEGRL